MTAIFGFMVLILYARSAAVNRTGLMEIATKLVRTIVIESWDILQFFYFNILIELEQRIN